MSTIASEQSAGRRAEHLAVVYEDDLELIRAVGEFSAVALRAGGSVVLLARAPHRAAADEWIRLCEADQARDPSGDAAERYISLDTDDVIDQLCADSDPAAALDSVFERARHRIPEGVEPVHVYGDLAATLWERGHLSLALEIEQLGMDMARDRGLSILCAYRSGTLASSSDLETVSRCHTCLVPRRAGRNPGICTLSRRGQPTRQGESPGGPPPPGKLSPLRSKVFPGVIPSCRAARRFVREVVSDAGSDPELAIAAELICSELAANAVRHARSPFTVDVAASPERIRLAVADEVQPGRGSRAADFPVTTSHGLGIVSALTAAWGVREVDDGKVVWADLERPAVTMRQPVPSPSRS